MMPATVETAVLWNEKQASQPQWGHEGRRKSGISPAMFLRRCGSVLHSGGAGGGGVCLGMPVRMMEPGDNTADEPHGGPLPVDAAQLLTNPPNISALSLTHKPTTCDFPTHTANFSAQLPTHPHNLSAPPPTPTPTTCHMTIFEGHNLPPLPPSQGIFSVFLPSIPFFHIICILYGYYLHIASSASGLAAGDGRSLTDPASVHGGGRLGRETWGKNGYPPAGFFVKKDATHRNDGLQHEKAFRRWQLAWVRKKLDGRPVRPGVQFIPGQDIWVGETVPSKENGFVVANGILIAGSCALTEASFADLDANSLVVGKEVSVGVLRYTLRLPLVGAKEAHDERNAALDAVGEDECIWQQLSFWGQENHGWQGFCLFVRHRYRYNTQYRGKSIGYRTVRREDQRL